LSYWRNAFAIADCRFAIEKAGEIPSFNRKFQIANHSLPFDFMQRVAAEARAVLLDLDLLRAAGDLDLGAVVQVARFGALKPHHFSAFFCHDEYLSWQ